MSGAADTLSGEIIGFRQWVLDDDLRLCSSAMPHKWRRDVNEARCLSDTLIHAVFHGKHHECPAPDCHCGLYALHTPQSFWYQRTPDTLSVFGYSERQYVAGLISAWGRVQVHHDGFRAQYARPVAIAIPPHKRDGALARAVAAEYGLPTVPQDELERIAPEFGSLVPEDLRPAAVPKPDAMDLRALGGYVHGYAASAGLFSVATSGFAGNTMTVPIAPRSGRPLSFPPAYLPPPPSPPRKRWWQR